MRRSYMGGRQVLAAAAIVAPLVACSTADQSATPRATEATPSMSPAPSPSVFESERHAYTVEVPAGWDVTEYTGTWTRLIQFSPGAEVPGEDVVLSPDGGAFLVSNSMAIPRDMTDAEWLEAFDARVTAGLDPDCPGKRKSGDVAGEPATIITQRCEGMVVVGRSLTHEDRGYYFTTGFPAEDSVTAATLDDIVASIRFV
jgi:hypothetical protein